jgi:hypothetical protein
MLQALNFNEFFGIVNLTWVWQTGQHENSNTQLLSEAMDHRFNGNSGVHSKLGIRHARDRFRSKKNFNSTELLHFLEVQNNFPSEVSPCISLRFIFLQLTPFATRVVFA